eukprot:327897-Rhodomonas_salina.1
MPLLTCNCSGMYGMNFVTSDGSPGIPELTSNILSEMSLFTLKPSANNRRLQCGFDCDPTGVFASWLSGLSPTVSDYPRWNLYQDSLSSVPCSSASVSSQNGAGVRVSSTSQPETRKHREKGDGPSDGKLELTPSKDTASGYNCRPPGARTSGWL